MRPLVTRLVTGTVAVAASFGAGLWAGYSLWHHDAQRSPEVTKSEKANGVQESERQVTSQPDEDPSEDKFSFGVVLSVSADCVNIKEYDFTKDADVAVAYKYTPETEFGNIDKITDLKPGDNVVVDYVDQDGKRVITTIVKEAVAPECSTRPDETAWHGTWHTSSDGQG